MQFTRTRYALLTALLAIAALVLAGCGGDDGGLSTEEMARLAAAEEAAAMAQAAAAEAEAEAMTAHEEAEAAKMEAAAAHAEAEQAIADAAAAQAEAEKEVEIPEPDTSAIDDALAALEATVAELSATPMTPLEILGGTKSTASANDRNALATAIAKQLNMAYDHDGDKSMVNLPDIDGPGATSNKALTRNVAHATAGDKIMSADGTSKDGGFLKHTFTGGPMVDLTSPGDIATLKLRNLLKVNGVDLKSFSVRETDKMWTRTTNSAGLDRDATSNAPIAVADATHTTKTTLRDDGSSFEVRVQDDTGRTTFSKMITFAGGSKIVEYDPLLDADATLTDGITETVTNREVAVSEIGAQITSANGRRMTYQVDGTDAEMYADEAEVTGIPTTNAPSPAADLAAALRAYANAGSAYTIAQHAAEGYGAWLEDSFFVAYVISAEDDAILSDPDDMAMKVAWGGRAHDSDVTTRLSGRGETAMWKGLMVGHDIVGEEMVKGNASVTARISDAVLADQQAGGTLAADVVDVSLTNIINAEGTAVSRVADGIHWTNLDLSAGKFEKGDEIMGAFYDSGNEVVGQFNKESILGAFGAMEYEMEDMMDMASQ